MGRGGSHAPESEGAARATSVSEGTPATETAFGASARLAEAGASFDTADWCEASFGAAACSEASFGTADWCEASFGAPAECSEVADAPG